MKFTADPDKKYRSAPFWSLNGSLDERELKEQIKALKEMGFGGAFIHSRTGLATEYMGEEWLKLVRACGETLESEGMDAWLYDEDRWPSGTCGGYVTENPQFRRSFMSARFCERGQFDLKSYGAEYIASFAVRLSGKSYAEHAHDMPKYSGMTLSDYFPTTHFSQIPDGYLGMVITVEYAEPSEFYNGYTYADTMAKEPTELYLKLTHDKYAKAMGDLFGGAIKGIFTDEPHRGAAFNGFGISNANGYSMIPYTPKLFGEYRARWGEELREKLPELWFASSEPDGYCETSRRYFEVCQELFLKNFLRPIYNWCRSHGIKLTGHMLQENDLASQTSMLGSAMRFYEYEDYPGIDNLGTEETNIQTAIAVSSVAKQLGKKFALSELYGATGWKTTFQEYKQIGDWQALFGVNLRCPHLSWYTMKGEAKRDYPASINKQANWYKEYRAVEDYFARLTKVLTECKPITEALVISPIESAWGLVHMGGYHSCFSVRDEAFKRLDARFAALTDALAFAGIDFDYGDEEIMSRKSAVGSDGRGAFITVGKVKYREVILPEMLTVRESTLGLLREFAAAGGKVWPCGKLPPRVDGKLGKIDLPHEEIPLSEIAGKAGRTGCARIELCSDGKFYSKLKSAGRGELILFTVNASRATGYSAEISLEGKFRVEKFDLRTGKTESFAARYERGKTTVRYCFAPSEELLLHFVPGAPQKAEVSAENEAAELKCEGVSYELTHPNALVLDRAKVYVAGAPFAEGEVLKADNKLREEFRIPLRSGVMIQPWYRALYDKVGYGKIRFDLTLKFEFIADCDVRGARLMAESYGSCKVKLNGHELTAPPETSPVDPCFSLVDIDDSFFVRGKNVLECEYAFSDSTDLENFFILGDFGVKAGNPSHIVPLPEKLEFGDVCSQGLPFYAGGVTYLLPIDDGEYEATVSDFYAACLKSCNEIAAFEPYKLRITSRGGVARLTAVLTPKNLFGPLHEVPPIRERSGPWDFRTEGIEWSDDYALIPQGLFRAPVLRKLK